MYVTNAVILAEEPKAEIKIYNSYLISKVGQGLRVNSPAVIQLSNVIFYNTSITTANTIYDYATSGTTNIDIGARCISTNDLPSSAGALLLNRTGGDFDCGLIFSEPFIDV